MNKITANNLPQKMPITVAPDADEVKLDDNSKTKTPSPLLLKLHHVRNTMLTPLKGIKVMVSAVAANMKKVIGRLFTSAKTPTAPTTKNPTDTFIDMLTNPNDRRVTPKNILNTLTNDGATLGINGKAIIEFLNKNPTHPGFTKANMLLLDTKIEFKTPIIMADGTRINALQCDHRDCNNGEFRGSVAMYVLSDDRLEFANLNELCEKLTLNPQRNFMQMRLAKFVAFAMGDPELRAMAQTVASHSLGSLVFLNETSGEYEPRFDAKNLSRPTNWSGDSLPASGRVANARSIYLNNVAVAAADGSAGQSIATDKKPTIKTGAQASVKTLQAFFEKAGAIKVAK